MRRCIQLSLAAAVLTAAGPASADAGVPMLMLAWPGAFLLLVPIILAEGLFARRILDLSWRESLKISALANLLSTVAGIPLTWVVLVILEFSVGLLVAALPLQHPVWRVVFLPLFSAWLVPGSQPWMLYAGMACLCVPFGAVSIWLEAKFAAHRLGPERIQAVRQWSFRANATTYLILFAVLVALAVNSAASSK